MNKPNKDDKSPIEKGMEYIKEELAKPKLVWDEEEKLERMKTIWINGLQIAVISAREETLQEVKKWLLGDYDKSNNLVRIDLREFDKKFSKNKKVER